MRFWNSAAAMDRVAFVLGILAGLYGVMLVAYGHVMFDLADVTITLLLSYFLQLLPLVGLLGGALALYSPAMAAPFLLMSAGGWLALGTTLGFGMAITIVPLLLSIVAAALTLSAAGPREFVIAVDRLNTWVGKFFAFTVVILTVVVCYEVFMRYVMRAPTRWAYDAGYMLYGAGFLMAGAYALARSSHVRADVLYRFWPPRVQASVDLVLFLLFFFPAAFFFVYSGYIFADRSWTMGEFSSASPFNIPVYHFKTFIPVAGVLLFIQGLAELARCGICLYDGRWPPRIEDVEEIEKQAMEGHVARSVAGRVISIDQAHELGLDTEDEARSKRSSR